MNVDKNIKPPYVDNKVHDLVKKYGVTGILVTALPFAIPYIDSYIAAKQNDTVRLIVKEESDRVVSTIVTNLEKNLEVAIKGHSKTLITDGQALYIMKTSVGFQSIYKIDAIMDILNKYPMQIGNVYNDNKIKNAIKGELIRQSAIYVGELNRFIHPKLGTLGTYIADQFPMSRFLDDVYTVALTIDCTSKRRDLMYLMLQYQNQLWDDTKVRLLK